MLARSRDHKALRDGGMTAKVDRPNAPDADVIAADEDCRARHRRKVLPGGDGLAVEVAVYGKITDFYVGHTVRPGNDDRGVKAVLDRSLHQLQHCHAYS